jgi:segregation and condensation protein A
LKDDSSEVPAVVATTPYHVTLDIFEGPLDLLLRLIERQELDISLISLALVADQYLASIDQLRDVPASNLADFLVIAARLLVIKSRYLLPRPPQATDGEGEEDVGEALARQLQEYKRFKALALQLREMEESGLKSYPRVAPPPQIERPLEPGQVTPQELLEAIKRALAAHPLLAPVDGVVAPVAVRIGDCIRTIQGLLRQQPIVRFSDLMCRARSRTEVLVTFMAILELIRQQLLRATQEAPFAEILLESRQPDPEAPAPVGDLSEYGEADQLPGDDPSETP